MHNRIRGVSAPVLVAAALIAVAIVAAVALVLSSGGDDGTSDASPTPTVAASETWRIEFQRTGGFAGLVQRLSLDSDGAVTFEDLRDQRIETGMLDATELSELRALIDSSDFFAQASPQEAPCADCFDLTITVRLDGRTHTVEAIDIGLDESLKPLAERLITLLEDGLTP